MSGHQSWHVLGRTAKEIVLPTIADSPASGAIIKVAGITGRIRGMKFKKFDGSSVRPSLVVLDDPQTDESARSLSQCANRESILAGAVLGLAGPGKKISGIMPCTVIRPGDMADNILDRDKHPEWNGERTRMAYYRPTRSLAKSIAWSEAFYQSAATIYREIETRVRRFCVTRAELQLKPGNLKSRGRCNRIRLAIQLIAFSVFDKTASTLAHSALWRVKPVRVCSPAKIPAVCPAAES